LFTFPVAEADFNRPARMSKNLGQALWIITESLIPEWNRRLENFVIYMIY